MLVGETRIIEAEGDAGAGDLCVVYSRTSNLAGLGLDDMAGRV